MFNNTETTSVGIHQKFRYLCFIFLSYHPAHSAFLLKAKDARVIQSFHMRFSNYQRLLLFMLVVLWSGAFAKTILPPHYLDQGITYMAMIIGTLIVFGAQFLFL